MFVSSSVNKFTLQIPTPSLYFALYFDLYYSYSMSAPLFSSDWSMHPLPHLPEYMWVHAKKIGDGLEVYISEDSFDWMQIRQGDISDDAILQVGLYGASPNSDDGFEVTFEDFMIKDEER
mmetsp:Transcript_635/g.1620  ORF Transcript_635/g.1620 Transcript_635/m.1620 type:complete len:120 (+) Transcript_635:706-1065(+)